MADTKRVLLSVVFVLAAMVIGLALGTMVGGRYFVPPGSGLAGPAIALGYGVMGALAALVVALLGIKVVPHEWQVRAAIPVLGVGLALVVLIARGVVRSGAEQHAALEEAYERTRPFTVTMSHAATGAGPFREATLEWGERRRLAVTRGDGQRCVAELGGRQASQMLGALREVEGILYRDEFPCAGTVGTVERRLEFTIIEATPPNNSGDLAITAACAASHQGLDGPFEAAAEIVADSEHPLECAG